MKFRDIFRMILRNLTKRKTRTALTISGVVIGTCAIIVMLSLGIGMSAAQAQIVGQWADLTMITVYNQRAVSLSTGNKSENMNSGEAELEPLNVDMVENFRNIKHVRAVSPFEQYYMSIGDNLAMHTDDIAFTDYSQLVGVDMDSLEAFGYDLQEGRWKNEGDGSYAVILGNYVGFYTYDFIVDEYLYGEYDEETWTPKSYPINPLDPASAPDGWKLTPISSVDSNGNWYSSDYDKYAVLTSPTAINREYSIDLNPIGRLAQSQDWQVTYSILIDVNSLPIIAEMYNEVYPDSQITVDLKNGFSQVRVRVDDMNNVKDVQDYIQDTYGYQTYSNTESLEAMKASTNMIQLILGALAAVSLFVAALNITNTMIMAVIERTREIGIMKVLGCDLSRIRMIFLGEAASIGILGGLVGAGLSFLLSFVFNKFLGVRFMSSMNNGMDMSMLEGTDISVITPWLVLLGIGFATFVGILAGFGPANRSVKISALSAITNEQ